MGIVCSYVSHQLQLHKFDRAENPKCLHKIQIQIRKYPKREVKSSSSNNNNTKNDIEPTHQNPTQNIIEIIIFIFVSFVCYRCVCVCIMAVDSSKLCRKLPLMLFFLSCLVRLPGIRLWIHVYTASVFLCFFFISFASAFDGQLWVECLYPAIFLVRLKWRQHTTTNFNSMEKEKKNWMRERSEHAALFLSRIFKISTASGTCIHAIPMKWDTMVREKKIKSFIRKQIHIHTIRILSVCQWFYFSSALFIGSEQFQQLQRRLRYAVGCHPNMSDFFPYISVIINFIFNDDTKTL